MIITLLATNIEYDTDGPGIPTTHDLPASMEVQVDLDIQVAAHTLGMRVQFFEDINRQVCNQISDETGLLVLDYQLIGYTPQTAV
jgi:hypothetical protein|tara:strand:+ start:754 stop:1008 length:255 start_codon:yes stop_codon:yes gene_type:complete